MNTAPAVYTADHIDALLTQHHNSSVTLDTGKDRSTSTVRLLTAAVSVIATFAVLQYSDLNRVAAYSAAFCITGAVIVVGAIVTDTRSSRRHENAHQAIGTTLVVLGRIGDICAGVTATNEPTAEEHVHILHVFDHMCRTDLTAQHARLRPDTHAVITDLYQRAIWYINVAVYSADLGLTHGMIPASAAAELGTDTYRTLLEHRTLALHHPAIAQMAHNRTGGRDNSPAYEYVPADEQIRTFLTAHRTVADNLNDLADRYGTDTLRTATQLLTENPASGWDTALAVAVAVTPQPAHT
jgi:hypothetical protein